MTTLMCNHRQGFIDRKTQLPFRSKEFFNQGKITTSSQHSGDIRELNVTIVKTTGNRLVLLHQRIRARC